MRWNMPVVIVTRRSRTEPSCVRTNLLRLGELGDDLGPHHLAEERFLGVEVEVDGALAYAREAGDVVDLGPRESHVAEHLLRGVDDLVGAVFGAALPARGGALGRRRCVGYRRVWHRYSIK